MSIAQCCAHLIILSVYHKLRCESYAQRAKLRHAPFGTHYYFKRVPQTALRILRSACEIKA